MASPDQPVTLTFRDGIDQLFVGTYAPIVVAMDDAAGLAFDELDVTVPAGLSGGLVSLAHGPGFTEKQPEIMLLVGYAPGGYAVEARVRDGGRVVGTLRYEIIDHWAGTDGPPRWFSGRQPIRSGGAAWGSGNTDAPQNVNVLPAIGTRRVAILLVDMAGQRYPTFPPARMEAVRQRWLNEIALVTTQPDDVKRSSAAWYREVSYGAFTLTAKAFGPVHLSHTFNDYIGTDGAFKGSYQQECVTAALGMIDFTQFDTVILVSPTVPATATTKAQSAWPYATIQEWGPFITDRGPRMLGFVSMTSDWGVADDREIFETGSHEIGHNLGLQDQYRPVVSKRNVMGWDIMDRDLFLPDLTLVHRMMLGWFSADWLRRLDLIHSAPVDETVRLSRVEQGAPAPNTYAGIELRIADGLNYYVEYRGWKTPEIGDRELPAPSQVILLDAVSPPFRSPMARPLLLMLPPSPDGTRPVLGADGSYAAKVDPASPTPSVLPPDFRIDVSGLDGTKADVRIRYGQQFRPDPSIRPAPASPNRPYQSPDIEIRNARSDADPKWLNLFWLGHPNRIVARVKNGGNIPAPGVRADFYVKSASIGGGAETLIGSVVQDVAEGATADFLLTWTPPANQNGSNQSFAIVVRVPPYAAPAVPPATELSQSNNVAESSYTRADTVTSSPSSRVVTSYTVTNPFRERTRVFVVAGQSNPLFRTFVEHAWLWLDPEESREVGVLHEFALDPGRDEIPPDIQLSRSQIEKYRRIPNVVAIQTQIEDPADEPRHRLEILGGAQIEVRTGRATRIDPFGADGRQIRGAVVTADAAAQPVDGGTVVVTVDRDGSGPTTYEYHSVPVRGGEFLAVVRPGWRGVQADFLPPDGYGPSGTGWR